MAVNGNQYQAEKKSLPFTANNLKVQACLRVKEKVENRSAKLNHGYFWCKKPMSGLWGLFFFSKS